LVSVVWAVLLAGIAICLVVSVATNAWQMQQRTAEKAQYTVERMELQACIRGIKAQAADLGSRAVVAVMQSQARAKQVMLLSAELQAKTVGQQIQQQGQVRSISLHRQTLQQHAQAASSRSST
jgi:ribonuclease HI